MPVVTSLWLRVTLARANEWEAAKNRFVKIDGIGDLLQRSMTFACGTAYLIAYRIERSCLWLPRYGFGSP